MSNRITRRTFIRSIGYGGAALPLVMPRLVRAVQANGILRHASAGAAGMAGADMGSLSGHKAVRIVAIADVDANNLKEAAKNYPDAKLYQDWRVMLDKEGRNFDSINVSTPDHMHAPIGVSAMQLGKHVYGQKPLGQNLHDTRQMAVQARKAGVVTQMGIQIHSHTYYRLAVMLVQNGAIGKVKEVHSWSGKKWGDPDQKPHRTDTPPDWLNWDLWLGVAAERAFIGGGYYHPGNWRKRLDFGTGTFGDMGCHIYDPVFNALGVDAPISVHSTGPKPNEYNWAINAKIHYVFPATKFTEGDTVSVTWYDGDERPPAEVVEKIAPQKMPDQGSIFIGTKGVILLPHVSRPHLLPAEQYKDYDYPKFEAHDHYMQFVEACLGNGKTSANFDYAGALTEAVLLGGVATHFPGQTLQWDAKALKVTNVEEANRFVRRQYRKGWEVAGLS